MSLRTDWTAYLAGEILLADLVGRHGETLPSADRESVIICDEHDSVTITRDEEGEIVASITAIPRHRSGRHRSPRRFLGACPEDWATWDQAAKESGEKNWADWARRVLRAAALTNR